MIVLATVMAETPLAEALIGRWVTRADQDHAARRHHKAARHHSLLARAGLRALLFQHSGQNEWYFHADGRGKLSARDAQGCDGPAICLAHTQGIVACAIGSGGGKPMAIGVDIEIHRPRNILAIAQWSFGPQECAQVANEDIAAFYRIWTLREAMGKTTGQGLALAADRRDRTEDGPATGLWRKRIDRQDWLLGHFRPTPSISLAIAGLVPHGDMDIGTALCWQDLGAI